MVEDVVYLIQCIQDSVTVALRAWSYLGIELIEVIDEYMVVMELAELSVLLFFLLVILSLAIVDCDVVEQQGNFNGIVDGGLGLFMLAECVVGQTIKFDVADQYWELGVSYLDGMDFTFNFDDNACFVVLCSGTIDFLWCVVLEFIEMLKVDESFNWYGGVGLLLFYLWLNISWVLFDDVRVWQVIYFVLDCQEIFDVANLGLGVLLNVGYFLADCFGAFIEFVYGVFDFERVQELFVEVGYLEGFDTMFLVILMLVFQVCFAEVEQQQLVKIGINVIFELAELMIVNVWMVEDDFDMFQLGFSVMIDLDERFMSSFTDGGGFNYGNWVDEEYEELIVEVRLEFDFVVRAGLYQDAECIFVECGLVVMIYIDVNYDVVMRDVCGYCGDGMPMYWFFCNLWLDC